jgi:hypothetical protein
MENGYGRKENKMVVMILPKFVIELEEKLKKVIIDISVKNKIDLITVKDSKAIENGISLISGTLVRIYENYDVEGREEFEKDMEKILKEKKK